MKKIFIMFTSSMMFIFCIIAILNYNSADNFYFTDLLSYLQNFPDYVLTDFIDIFKNVANKIISVPDFSQSFVNVVLDFFKYIFNLLLLPIDFVMSVITLCWNLLEYLYNFIVLIMS